MTSDDAEQRMRIEIAASRRILAAAGLDRDDIAGQVTARVAGEDALWTTPMDLFEATRPAHVVKLPFGTRSADGHAIVVDGSPVPVSTASGWVEALYLARPDIGCIIHTHAPYIGAVASTGEVVGLYINRSVMFHGEQAFYDDDGTGTDSPERIVAALGTHSILIQRNHGAVITGPDVPIATAVAVLLEAAARFHVLGKAAGGTPFADHPAFERRKQPHRANLRLVWNAHLRRVQRHDAAVHGLVAN
jgi:ribulose-5-phosphate 4-epimerase/fuculose-1-phosphate aldolase